MKKIFRKLTSCSVALVAAFLNSCSLEENNPAGFTPENIATTAMGSKRWLINAIFPWRDISTGRTIG